MEVEGTVVVVGMVGVAEVVVGMVEVIEVVGSSVDVVVDPLLEDDEVLAVEVIGLVVVL